MIFVTVERTPLSSTISRWLGDFTFFQYNRSPPYLLSIPAITLGAVFFAWSQTNGGQAKKSQLDGTWELVAGEKLPKGARNIKIIAGGHFIFAAYDTEKGELLYTVGGTCIFEREFLHRTRRLRR